MVNYSSKIGSKMTVMVLTAGREGVSEVVQRDGHVPAGHAGRDSLPRNPGTPSLPRKPGKLLKERKMGRSAKPTACHARVYEGVAKSQFPFKAVVFKS